MKILTLVLHSENTKERHGNITSTWGKDIDVLFYSDYENFLSNVIKVSDRKDYESCSEKIMNAFIKLPDSCLDYDWYFFCDDDTFLNSKLLLSSAAQFDSSFIYGDIIKCWPNDFSLPYPSGGAGCMISNSTFKKIRSFGVVYPVGFSDVCLGLNIRSLDIKMKHDSRFHGLPPQALKIDSKEVSKHISFHYIKTRAHQEQLYSLCE